MNLIDQLAQEQIAKLTAEIAALKGEETPPAALGAVPGGATSGLPTRPGVFGRGAAQAARGRPVARPIPTGPASTASTAGGNGAPPTVASIRGAAAGRGGSRIAAAATRGGRGAANANATAGAKRKLSAQGLNVAGAAGAGAEQGAKKPRAAGAPVAIRKPSQGGQGQGGAGTS